MTRPLILEFEPDPVSGLRKVYREMTDEEFAAILAAEEKEEDG